MLDLSKQVVLDGEGAKKFLTIKVQLQTQQKATFGLFGKNFLFEINQKDLSGI